MQQTTLQKKIQVKQEEIKLRAIEALEQGYKRAKGFVFFNEAEGAIWDVSFENPKAYEKPFGSVVEWYITTASNKDLKVTNIGDNIVYFVNIKWNNEDMVAICNEYQNKNGEMVKFFTSAFSIDSYIEEEEIKQQERLKLWREEKEALEDSLQDFFNELDKPYAGGGE